MTKLGKITFFFTPFNISNADFYYVVNQLKGII